MKYALIVTIILTIGSYALANDVSSNLEVQAKALEVQYQVFLEEARETVKEVAEKNGMIANIKADMISLEARCDSINSALVSTKKVYFLEKNRPLKAHWYASAGVFRIGGYDESQLLELGGRVFYSGIAVELYAGLSGDGILNVRPNMGIRSSLEWN